MSFISFFIKRIIFVVIIDTAYLFDKKLVINIFKRVFFKFGTKICSHNIRGVIQKPLKKSFNHSSLLS